jgi:hypothetical protein
MRFFEILPSDRAPQLLTEPGLDLMEVMRSQDLPSLAIPKKAGDVFLFLCWRDLFRASIVSPLAAQMEKFGDLVSASKDGSVVHFRPARSDFADVPNCAIEKLEHSGIPFLQKLAYSSKLTGREIGTLGIPGPLLSSTLYPLWFVESLAAANAKGYYLKVWESGMASRTHIFLDRFLNPISIDGDRKTMKKPPKTPTLEKI